MSVTYNTAVTTAISLSLNYSDTQYNITLTLCHLGWAGYVNEVVRKDTETTSGFSVDIENRTTSASASSSFDFYWKTEGFI